MLDKYSIDLLPEHFVSRIEKCNKTGCWNWIGQIDKDGYGRTSVDRKIRKAHRASYELLTGSIDDSLVIDHLCKNRKCVNPAHMEQVSIKENTLRGTSFSAVNLRKDTCVNGHQLDKENTYTRPNGKRDCRICIRNRVAAYDKRRKEKAA